MPLADSGAALFAGSAAEFITMAPASSLTSHVTREFNRRWATASEQEIRSWRNSLTALAECVEQSGIPLTGVGVELKLPLTDKRVDASFVGRDIKGKPQVMLVELKQWESVSPSAFAGNVVVGGREMLHPAIQAGAYAEYLRDSHSAFSEEGFLLSSCAFLHNLYRRAGTILKQSVDDRVADGVQLFFREDGPKLEEKLADTLGGGDGVALLPHLVNGRYAPSKRLIDSIATSLDENPVWTLLDEQRVALNLVHGLVQRAVKTGEKAVVVVVGGPGTGKSVIAVHLMITLSQEGLRVAHATGSKAFTINLRAISPRSTGAMFRYFNNFREKKTEPNDMDVIICDEAHRLRSTSNDRFTAKKHQSTISQVREIIRAGRVTVFFLDERQNVRSDEIGTVKAIVDGAGEDGIQVHKLHLDGQFRCNGCGGYIDWVDSLMSSSPTKAAGWLETGDYELTVFESPKEMEQALFEKAKTTESVRMVAGFCWPWSDPLSKGKLVADVFVGSWRRPWNEKSPEQSKPPRPAPSPRKHPYYLWATEPKRIGEIGCIYSAQGFEFDYCGVILGPDLVWREGIGWVGDRAASEDPAIKKRKFTSEALRTMLQHTYRVLLTRGMKGTYLYSTDPETRLFLRGLVGNP